MLPTLPVTPPASRVWRVIHFPPVLLIVGLGLMALGAAIAHFVGVGTAARESASGLVAIAVALETAAICAGVYWLFVRFVERRPRVDEFAAKGALPELLAGLFTGTILFAAIVAIIWAAGGYSVLGTNPPAVLLPVLAIAIVSGVTEEIIFRGLVFRILERWLGSGIALVVSALIFGLLHLANPNATLLAGFAIALEAGVMLAAIYMLTRRLWAAIGVHAAWNFAQGGIFGIPISGLASDGLLRPRITGPDLLTGGDFGAEASLPAIVVATAFGLALLWRCHVRGRFVAPSWRRAQESAAPVAAEQV
ncbi:CPBP family intramembrane metalloprotease [Sphingomonas sp. EC-HK361]|uniref:CPBP family intramembrane glutamic endopeptidase n=1 Tax=Sphingomonas sp. EC-HK361 TaxID=2038397 RepID=UPI0012550054|nr:CPBP family intramembrane glutamic endopeptidase [Sphingomonas sp. EC-HK361]VVT04876.1 CPBP family intramembrane metalloprotease [Sphingomonas sp. EC-HK361]